MEDVSSVWSVLLRRGLSLGGVLSLGWEIAEFNEIVETEGIEDEIVEIAGGLFVSFVWGFGEDFGCGIEYENFEEGDG